jgi:hypothetical protein
VEKPLIYTVEPYVGSIPEITFEDHQFDVSLTGIAILWRITHGSENLKNLWGSYLPPLWLMETQLA